MPKAQGFDRLILAGQSGRMGRTLRKQVALYLDDHYIELLDRLATKAGQNEAGFIAGSRQYFADRAPNVQTPRRDP
jgi:hypothetical protein